MKELEQFIELTNKLPQEKLQRLKHLLLMALLQSCFPAQDEKETERGSAILSQILAKRLLKEENKRNKIGTFLRELIDNPRIDDELRAKINDFVAKNDLKTNQPPADLAALKIWWDEQNNSDELPSWQDLDFHILDAVETRLSKMPAVVDTLEKILDLYDYEYDLQLDIRNFAPGAKQFNPNLHNALRKTRSQYHHNTIIEVLKMGILSKQDGRHFRKALVVVSFNK